MRGEAKAQMSRTDDEAAQSGKGRLLTGPPHTPGMRVRTGRFTYREYAPHSDVSVRFHPKRTHTDQALFLQP